MIIALTIVAMAIAFGALVSCGGSRAETGAPPKSGGEKQKARKKTGTATRHRTPQLSMI